jgi:hypothetical protein
MEELLLNKIIPLLVIIIMMLAVIIASFFMVLILSHAKKNKPIKLNIWKKQEEKN